MSTAKRRIQSGLIRRLTEQPERFGFFQATRLLRRYFTPGLSGGSQSNRRQLSYVNDSKLGFSASEIAGAQFLFDNAANDGDNQSRRHVPVQLLAAEITPAFIGMLGIHGALPLPYTDIIERQAQQSRDPAARAFLDIFTHRAAQLFFDAWKKYRLPIRYEMDGRRAGLAPLLALAGKQQPSLSTSAANDRHWHSAESTAFYAGTFWRRRHSARAIEQVLADYFELPFSATQFLAHWYRIPREQQTSLSGNRQALGAGAVLGQRVLQCDLRLRLEIGPLPAETFRDFLPGGVAQKAMQMLIRQLTGIGLEYEIRLVLRSRDVKGVSLTRGSMSRLGHNSFLITRPAVNNRHDAGYLI